MAETRRGTRPDQLDEILEPKWLQGALFIFRVLLLSLSLPFPLVAFGIIVCASSVSATALVGYLRPGALLCVLVLCCSACFALVARAFLTLC